jgi:hypothetical protein
MTQWLIPMGMAGERAELVLETSLGLPGLGA